MSLGQMSADSMPFVMDAIKQALYLQKCLFVQRVTRGR